QVIPFQSQKSCHPSCHKGKKGIREQAHTAFQSQKSCHPSCHLMAILPLLNGNPVSISKELPPVLPPPRPFPLCSDFPSFQSQKSCHPSCHEGSCTFVWKR